MRVSLHIYFLQPHTFFLAYIRGYLQKNAYPIFLWIEFHCLRERSSYYSLGKAGLILRLFWQRISSCPILNNSLFFWTLSGWAHQRWNMRENPIQTHSSLKKCTRITILSFSWSVFKDHCFKAGYYLRFPVLSSEYY